jgi:hypothetical protein
MAKYALVGTDDVIIEFREYEVPPDAVTDSDTKPRLLPVVLQSPAYDPVSEVNEGPVYTVRPADVLEAWTKRPKNADEIEMMRQSKIGEVHREADKRQPTIQQQIRSLSRLVDLLYRHTDTSTWPAAQQQSVAEHTAKLDSINEIKSIEETKVAQVEALATPQEIAAYDATAGWEVVNP